MENIVISIKNRKYDSNKAIRNLLNYIVREKGSSNKVKYWGTKGLSKDMTVAADQFIKSQKLLRKNKNRRAYHIIVSFPEDFKNVKFVKKAAEKIADYFYQDFQVVYGVHTNEDNLHFHLAINSVSYVTGLKYHKSKSEMKKMRDEIISIINNIS